MTAATACPCGSGRAYPACCGPLHAGEPAPDAQALMRSRYSAYVREDAAYLLRTWQASTRPDTLDFAADARPTWLGLKVLSHQLDDAGHARVAFVARYRIGGGSAVRMREHSRFVREHGQWRYLDAGGDAP